MDDAAGKGRRSDAFGSDASPGRAGPDAFSRPLRLSLAGGRGLILKLYFLLQTGVAVRVDLTKSIRQVLCALFRVSPEYIEKKIETVFVNSQPVDDFDSPRLTDGDNVALSAAMPGLVGAAMRRGGFYAPLRSTITYAGASPQTADTEGTVTIRLFNTLIGELGPRLLEDGVFVGCARMEEFFSGRDERFWTLCTSVLLDGAPCSQERLMASLKECAAGAGYVLFSAREEARDATTAAG